MCLQRKEMCRILSGVGEKSNFFVTSSIMNAFLIFLGSRSHEEAGRDGRRRRRCGSSNMPPNHGIGVGSG